MLEQKNVNIQARASVGVSLKWGRSNLEGTEDWRAFLARFEGAKEGPDARNGPSGLDRNGRQLWWGPMGGHMGDSWR